MLPYVTSAFLAPPFSGGRKRYWAMHATTSSSSPSPSPSFTCMPVVAPSGSMENATDMPPSNFAALTSAEIGRWRTHSFCVFWRQTFRDHGSAIFWQPSTTGISDPNPLGPGVTEPSARTVPEGGPTTNRDSGGRWSHSNSSTVIVCSNSTCCRNWDCRLQKSLSTRSTSRSTTNRWLSTQSVRLFSRNSECCPPGQCTALQALSWAA